MTWCKAPVRGQVLRSTAALVAALSLGACEFPTEAPIFESRFVVPSEETTLSVSQLLPNSVTVAGGAFQLTVAPVSLNRTLGQLCPACIPFNGQTVPYPGFSATIPLSIALPSDVASAALSAGSIQLAIQNTFGFDPLSPPGATSAGNMTVTVVNAGRTLGSTVITGPFPTGTTKTALVTLAPGAISGPIDVSVAVTSPQGGTLPSQFVTINTNGGLNITVTPQVMTVSSATVTITNRNVSVDAIPLDLSEIDESLADRAVSGAIVLKMTNPFNVGGTLVLRVQGGGVNITKNVLVAPGTSTQRVEFTGAELRSMLGNDVTLTISGPVSGVGGNVTITPTQVLTIGTSLDLVVQIGGTVN